MILTKQQRYVLDILDKLGCARKDQLGTLLHAKFYPPEKPLPAGLMDSLLRQFAFCNIRLNTEGDAVFLPGKKPESDRLAAVDVMLELSMATPTEFWAEKGPFLLHFSVAGDRVNLFAVLHAARCSEIDVRAPPALNPSERVVILLDGECRPPALALPNPQFYAIRQENGTHRFFAKENHKT